MPEDIAKALRESFDHKQLVQRTATVASYRLVPRFLAAMALNSDDKVE
jgi:hypothetical protein